MCWPIRVVIHLRATVIDGGIKRRKRKLAELRRKHASSNTNLK
jgi:hypothetical protein